MGRGRALSTKRTEARAIAKAIAEGIAKADQKKPLEESVKDHLGRMIDRVDPLELITIGALTVVIEPIVAAMPKVVEFAKEFNLVGVGFLGYELMKWLIGIITPERPPEKEVAGELGSWLISFIIAFFIVRYGPQILQALGGLANLTGIIIGKV